MSYQGKIGFRCGKCGKEKATVISSLGYDEKNLTVIQKQAVEDVMRTCSCPERQTDGKWICVTCSKNPCECLLLKVNAIDTRLKSVESKAVIG